VEEWHIPGKTASKRVRYRLQTRTVERLSARHQTVLATFLGFRKPLYSCTEGMCHSSTRPGTSYHVTQAFPRVSTASNKRWGEKAWVRGYRSNFDAWSFRAKPDTTVLKVTYHLPLILEAVTKKLQGVWAINFRTLYI